MGVPSVQLEFSSIRVNPSAKNEFSVHQFAQSLEALAEFLDNRGLCVQSLRDRRNSAFYHLRIGGRQRSRGVRQGLGKATSIWDSPSGNSRPHAGEPEKSRDLTNRRAGVITLSVIKC